MSSTSPNSEYRLQTADPLKDLERWLITPNHTLDNGEVQGRNKEFVKQPRFTDEIQRKALGSAISHIRCHHAHIQGLIEYGSRKPYNLDLSAIARDADVQFMDTVPQVLGVITTRTLESSLLTAAKQIDYLSHAAEVAAMLILDKKKQAARDGYMSEVQDLLEGGVITHEWIWENIQGFMFWFGYDQD